LPEWVIYDSKMRFSNNSLSLILIEKDQRHKMFLTFLLLMLLSEDLT